MEGLEGIWISIGLSGMWLMCGVVIWMVLRDRKRRRREKRGRIQRMLDEARRNYDSPEDIELLERRLREIDRG